MVKGVCFGCATPLSLLRGNSLLVGVHRQLVLQRERRALEIQWSACLTCVTCCDCASAACDNHMWGFSISHRWLAGPHWAGTGLGFAAFDMGRNGLWRCPYTGNTLRWNGLGRGRFPARKITRSRDLHLGARAALECC